MHFVFRRRVEAQIEAADGAPAAHVTVLGGLAEFERQPLRERPSAPWRTVWSFAPSFSRSWPKFKLSRYQRAEALERRDAGGDGRTRRVGADYLVAVAKWCLSTPWRDAQ